MPTTVRTAAPVAQPSTATPSFADLGTPAALCDVLTQRGLLAPFPIQAATMSDAMAGRDVLGRGRTGSGKTLAFSLPTVARLAASTQRRRPHAPRALILVPTRELATQVRATIDPLAEAMGLRTMTIFGGVGQNPQVTALRQGVDICVATPGRLEDLVKQGHCRLDSVEISVLDEADHMADLGFLPGVTRLLSQTPKGTQRLLFSATLDAGVDVLVRRFLHNPVTHSVDTAASPVPAMTHHLFMVAHDDKPAVVRELVSGEGRTLAFTRTKHTAKKLAKRLTAEGVPAVDLHGNLSQNARERNLAAFHAGTVRVLVATDIAARGIHVDDITLVVHVDPPAEHKAYLHRSGRTARAGAEGVVVTVGTDSETGDIRSLMRQAKIAPKTVRVAPGHDAIGAITGPAAPYVKPSPLAEQAPVRAGSSARRPARAPRTGQPTRTGQPSRTASPGNRTGQGGNRQGQGGARRRPAF